MSYHPMAHRDSFEKDTLKHTLKRLSIVDQKMASILLQ